MRRASETARGRFRTVPRNSVVEGRRAAARKPHPPLRPLPSSPLLLPATPREAASGLISRRPVFPSFCRPSGRAVPSRGRRADEKTRRRETRLAPLRERRREVILPKAHPRGRRNFPLASGAREEYDAACRDAQAARHQHRSRSGQATLPQRNGQTALRRRFQIGEALVRRAPPGHVLGMFLFQGAWPCLLRRHPGGAPPSFPDAPTATRTGKEEHRIDANEHIKLSPETKRPVSW